MPLFAPTTDKPCTAADRACARRSRHRLVVLAILVAAVVAIHLSGAFDAVTVEGFLERREALAAMVAAHPVRALAGFVLLYTTMVAFSLPGALFLTLGGGFLFGPLLGGTAAAFSATLGATVLYAIARSSLGGFLKAKVAGRIPPLEAGDCFFALLFLRLVPIAPFWLVNIVPAVIDMPLKVFVTATAIGILPATFAFATLGAGLESVLAAQAAAKADCLAAGTCKLSLDPASLVTPELLAGFLALGLLALVPPVARVVKRRRARSAP